MDRGAGTNRGIEMNRGLGIVSENRKVPATRGDISWLHRQLERNDMARDPDQSVSISPIGENNKI